MRTYVLWCLTCLSVLAAQSALCQGVYTLVSVHPESGGAFGRDVAGAGNVNNDRYDDVIVGAAYEDGGDADAGRAYVFSGDGYGTLYTLTPLYPVPGGLFGLTVAAAGDVNHDGFGEVIVGAPFEHGGATCAGRAYVFDGATGDTLYTLTSPNAEPAGGFASWVRGAGDVNNDLTDDLILGAVFEDAGDADAGRAYVFNAATADTFFSLASPNPEPGGRFGCSVSGIGDLDGDEHDDVAVGATQEDVGIITNAGTAYVFGGSSGELMYGLVSPNPQSDGYFGHCISGIGDANNDGWGDIAVGAPGESVAGLTAAGRAYVFSGSGGGLLAALQSPNPESQGGFGVHVGAAGDVDGDGQTDVIVGAPGEDGQRVDAGRAYILRGDGGGLLCTLESQHPEPVGGFGISVSGIAHGGDNGVPDVAVGGWKEDGGLIDAGRAYAFTTLPAAMVLRGVLSGGSLHLVWTIYPACAEYWVYGAQNEAYFVPGSSPGYAHRLAQTPPGTCTWSSSNGIGDTDHNWTYLVIAVDAAEQELGRSNRFGEFDVSSAAR